jgi:HupE / UreJ protein
MSERPHRLLSTTLLLLLACNWTGVRAHDIPGRVSVLAYVKPQEAELLALIRVPMEALTEVQFPVRGPGFLDLARAEPALTEAAQLYVLDALELFADGQRLSGGHIVRTRVAPLGDRSFVDVASALALVRSERLGDGEELYWKQGWLDVLLSYPLTQPAERFAMQAHFERLGVETHTALHFVPPSGAERVFTYVGAPGRIDFEPGFWAATSRFVALGFAHILGGLDHLLFLFCLVVVLRKVRALVPVITAFTVAHTITLLSSALGLTPTAAWFTSLIETLIALSILYMACENVLGTQDGQRWRTAFGFGLVHGFGFSFILADRMQFAGSHLLSSLLAFNLGVEFGQLLVLCLLVPALWLFFKYFPRERVGVVLLSAFAAHSAWHWFTERGEQLLAYRWQAPVLDTAFFAAALRWAMLMIACGAALWGLNELFARWRAQPVAPLGDHHGADSSAAG